MDLMGPLGKPVNISVNVPAAAVIGFSYKQARVSQAGMADITQKASKAARFVVQAMKQ